MHILAVADAHDQNAQGAIHLRRHRSGIVRHNIAFVFPGMVDADREGVVPDLCSIPNVRLSNWDGEAHAQKGVIPALVVEMLSPSTRKTDLVDKVEIYREAGIEEYGIFDRGEESVRIYPDQPPVLQPERSLAGGEGGASERNCGWRTISLPLTASG